MPSSRGKERKKGERKSTSKSTTSTQPNISADTEPNYIGFLYQIDNLVTNYGNRQPRILSIGPSEKKGNDIGRYWFPPVRKSQIRCTPGHLYRWPGEMMPERLVHRPKGLKQYHVTSVFFQAKQDNFLAVEKDCANEDISEASYGWSQIGFDHLSEPNPFMSKVEIGGGKEFLAAPADGTSWMPQILPMVYNYNRSPSVPKPGGQSGGLCGKLSLLIAMAAFSAPVERAEEIVSRSFGYNSWVPHELEVGIGRYQERGVIVRIYLDPDAEGVTPAHLKDFEDGKYGPIFDGEPRTKIPSASTYTHQHGQYATHSPASSIPRTFNYQCASTGTGQYGARSPFPNESVYNAPSGYSASTGNIIHSEHLTTEMNSPEPEIYDAEDRQREGTGQYSARSPFPNESVYNAPSGYPASTGNIIHSEHPTTQMNSPEPEIYDAEDRQREDDYE